MTNGPMQLVVIDFPEATWPIDFADHLDFLREQGTVRLVDAVWVSKDLNGEVNQIRGVDLDCNDAVWSGTLAGALFGTTNVATLRDNELGALAADGGEFGLGQDDILEIADLIPRGSATAMILIEHLWATGLREVARGANARVIAQGWVTPATLSAMGEEFAEEVSHR